MEPRLKKQRIAAGEVVVSKPPSGAWRRAGARMEWMCGRPDGAQDRDAVQPTFPKGGEGQGLTNEVKLTVFV